MRRTVFYISDGTGITAETIGHSVLTQFEGIDFETFRLPFVDSEEKAAGAAQRIRTRYAESGKTYVTNTLLLSLGPPAARLDGGFECDLTFLRQLDPSTGDPVTLST